MHDGIRLPLRRETRFSRNYRSDAHKLESEISRFMDGTAAIKAAEIKREWAGWPEETRFDFCNSCAGLSGQSDFPDILRFIIQYAEPAYCDSVALSIANRLPRDEAFDILVRILQKLEAGQTSNITQAIAMTKHPNAEITIRSHLARSGRILPCGKPINLSTGSASTRRRASASVLD